MTKWQETNNGRKFAVKKTMKEEPKEEKTISESEVSTPDNPEEQTLESAEEGLSAAQELENQLAEQKDKFLRLFAEFDNYKKRMAKEKLEYMSLAGKDVLLEMISIKEDFERAIKSFENSDDLTAIREGVGLIYDKLNKSLEKKGIKKIETIHSPFDVEVHEAITEIPVSEDAQKGMVVDEIEGGYTLHDKVIRFAKVVVGR